MSTKSNASNDIKYVLLPAVEARRREPKFQPWPINNAKYRERFRMKYPCHISTKNWKFVKDGLDDFRDGLPPPHDDIMLEPDRGPGPVILSQKRQVKATVSDPRQRIGEHQLYFSRALPTAEKRRQLIDYYISTLLDHPLAFFPHFQQVLSPDMYERVSRLLEGELSRVIEEEESVLADEHRDYLSFSSNVPMTGLDQTITDKTGSEQDTPSDVQAATEEEQSVKKKRTIPGLSTIVFDESGKAWDSDEYEKKQKNPYRWYIENQKRIQKDKGPTREEIAVSAMEAHLRKVAEHFCSWLYSLGGETNFDIDPSVVRNLFSTAYNTKPSLDVPIKIVQTTRIPAEIRDGVKETMIAETEEGTPIFSKPRPHPKLARSDQLMSRSFDASQSRKYRYGAWYLPTHLWQRSLISQPLQDPKKIQAERQDATRIRDEAMNAHLAPMHGVDAFKDFLLENNVRRLPKFISDVEEHRRAHPPDLTTSSIGIPRRKPSDFH